MSQGPRDEHGDFGILKGGGKERRRLGKRR